jgi:AcrR family transcriptional regulator
MASISRKQYLIETAMHLFCEFGYHGTGIDKIIKTAGVLKKTMYVYFRT